MSDVPNTCQTAVARLGRRQRRNLARFAAAPLLCVGMLSVAACDDGNDRAEVAIAAEEVTEAQLAWGEGIIAIGEVSVAGGDVETAATAHIDEFYAYGGDDPVLFKPTLASEDRFRTTFEGALSYFIGTAGTEDYGFALNPWVAVRWENAGTILGSDTALAMGKYYFTDVDGNETVAEYAFAYVKDADGNLKINLQHSSLPFEPN